MTAPIHADIAVVGAGAAGLFAAIFAARAARDAGRPCRVVALDGARKLGAKILVAGGGRCNVTQDAPTGHIDESAYAGSTRPAIRNVLRRFDVPETVAFFRQLGVELKREDTGKLFPVTDDAHTVLDALLRAAKDAGAELIHPHRVNAIHPDANGFVIEPAQPPPPAPELPLVHARRVILAAGGMALPRTGSDGQGYAIARALGHTTTPRIHPSLVPLLLPKDHFLTALSGLTFPATLELRAAGGKRLAAFTNSTLLTHFGLSGPSVLDISRYYLDALAQARLDRRPEPTLHLNCLPKLTAEAFDRHLLDTAKSRPSLSPARLLTDHLLPERLARALCAHARVDPSAPLHAMTKDHRRALVQAVTELPLPIAGDRGFTYAEVTAGGVPLAELNLKTMESRVRPGLHLCGEILDVDGRIGGFNFQWAWASGHVAGTAAAEALSHAPAPAPAPVPTS